MTGATLVSKSDTVNESRVYKGSFRDLPDETIYSDLFGLATGTPFDERAVLEKELQPIYEAIQERTEDGETFREASTEVGKAYLGTSDISLPIFPREEFINLAVRRTPFVEAMPQITTETKTVEQDSVTDTGQPEIGGEVGIPSDAAEETIETQQLEVSYWRVKGSVSGPVGLAAQTLRNSFSVDQDYKTIAMKNFTENLALNGDPTTNTTDGSVTDERGFTGLRFRLDGTSNDVTPQAGTGTSIIPEEIRRLQRLAGEDGGDMGSLMGITDLKTLTDLKNQADDHDPLEIRTVDGERTIDLGARGIRLDGMPIVVSDFMPNSDNSREFIVTDMRFSRMHNLSDLVMESLGKTRDSDDYFMKQYGVYELAAGAEDYSARLSSLA